MNENNLSCIFIPIGDHNETYFEYKRGNAHCRDNNKDLSKLYRGQLNYFASLLSIKHKGIKKEELIELLTPGIIFE